jgi:8-oxo-dGTP pyrophosphatase MutT (NUDIX family)
VSIALLELAERTLAAHAAERNPWRETARRCAVALILALRERHLHVLMIRRAERSSDPWSGHMAFPGGRMESSDRNGFAVAVRETWEEIGLALGPEDRCLGRLSEIVTHPGNPSAGLVVTPFVFLLERSVVFQANYEVAEVVWIPLRFLLESANRQQMEWRREGEVVTLPCYLFEGRRIWGMSLRMLDELLDAMRHRDRAVIHCC